MADQHGVFPFKGRVQNLTFFKSRNGYGVRKRSGISGDRIRNDPRFVRTREHIADFGTAARASKLLRKGITGITDRASDGGMSNRLTAAMFRVIDTDTTNPRGKGRVTAGDLTLLTDFAFNAKCNLRDTFKARFTPSVDRAAGTLSVEVAAYVPADEILRPQNATHYNLVAIALAVDFEGETWELATSETGPVPVDHVQRPGEKLSAAVTPATTKALFMLFCIEFHQLSRGSLYPVNDTSFNALEIVAVDPGGEQPVV